MKGFAEMHGEAVEKANRRLRVGNALNQFFNKYRVDMLAIKAEYGGADITKVSDFVVRSNFNQLMTDDTVVSEHKFLEVITDLLGLVSDTRDKLPPNDLEV